MSYILLAQVDAVLTMFSPLIQDQSDQPPGEEDPEDFAEEQGLLGRSVNSTNRINSLLNNEVFLGYQPGEVVQFSRDQRFEDHLCPRPQGHRNNLR
jgi:hypothetical protein